MVECEPDRDGTGNPVLLDCRLSMMDFRKPAYPVTPSKACMPIGVTMIYILTEVEMEKNPASGHRIGSESLPHYQGALQTQHSIRLVPSRKTAGQ